VEVVPRGKRATDAADLSLFIICPEIKMGQEINIKNREIIMERSVVIIKPDAIQRGVIGEIISRLERKGIKLIGIKMVQLTNSILNEHYSHLSDEKFFWEIKQFMMSTPVIVTCWEGLDCVQTIRQLIGITLSREAEPGTIRGDLAMSIQNNLVHASDSKDTAIIEIDRFFENTEIFSYDSLSLPCIYGNHET